MKLSFQFHELNFGMILLSMLFELDFELWRSFVAGT